MTRGEAVAIESARRATDERLRRLEAKIDMLLRAAEVAEDQRDLEGEIAVAYRRGYITGHHAQRRGAVCDPDAALAARRR
jgi:hypothetical protein